MKRLRKAVRTAFLVRPMSGMVELGSKPGVVRLWSGARFMIRPKTRDLPIIYDIYVRKPYHPLIGAIKDGSTIIDIGANIGVFSVMAGRRAKNVRVFGYEPFAQNFELLTRNIALNNLGATVTPVRCGVGGSGGMRKLSLSPDNTGGHSIASAAKGKTVEIELVTLKDVFDRHSVERCDFLKVDCEGAEYEILYAAPADILARVRTISMEYHTGGGIGSPVQLQAFLEENGFAVRTVGSPAYGMMYATRGG